MKICKKSMLVLLSLVVLALCLAGSATHSSLNGQRVIKAVRYMTDHLAEPISLEDIAGQTGLNPSYFSRLFRRYTDTSPYDYLTNLRISHGKMLLITTSESVTSPSLSSSAVIPSRSLSSVSATLISRGSSPPEMTGA